jgi:hypothetical protein
MPYLAGSQGKFTFFLAGTWKFSKIDMARYAAVIWSRDMQQGYAAEICSRDMQRGYGPGIWAGD